jgi:fructosamine-3-kinase
MGPWGAIAREIALATGEPFDPQPPADVGGGCINRAVRLTDGRRSFFVKLNEARLADMFEAEAEGLRALADSRSLRVPEPVCTGTASRRSPSKPYSVSQ